MNKNLKKLISTVAALAITATSAFTAFAANFSDVADTADYKVAVDNLVALGIVNGYEDGTFGPEKEITRAEASKMIVGTMGPAMMDAAEASKGSSNFTDVAGDHWASGFIAQGVSKGYINGMGDGTFAPNANVTYAQVVKMLVCVLGYGEDAEANGGWPNGYINQGSALEITDGVNVATADTAVNRGQVAMLINNALDTPIKGIVGYEQGFKMVDGQLVPTPVPVTVVYNGKDRDYPEYETLLTTYFDAYAVRGRIMNTESKGKGYVSFDVEYSENFEDEAVGVKGRDSIDEPVPVNELYYPAGLDVDALLCTYADAIIMENEDGDWELISITSYGKNEIVELPSELYYYTEKDDDKIGSFVDGKVIEFYKSEASSKRDDYTLDEKVQVFVNGRSVEDNAAAINTYVLNNKTTEVKLVNTPEAGNKSVDSDYDFIMLSVYTSALIDEVMVDDEKAEIYIEKYNDAVDFGLSAKIEIDLEAVAEGEAEYSIVDVDGNEVALDALAKDDVVTIYADFINGVSNPDFIDIVVSKNVVNGKVVAENSEYDKYTVGSEEYGFANNVLTLNVGDTYDLYLDMFNKIVKAEIAASTVNYGIINKVWENSNGEKVVRLVNADGTIVTYEFNKPADFGTVENNTPKSGWVKKYSDAVGSDFFKAEEVDGKTVYSGAYQDMVVTYKLTASDKIHAIQSVGTGANGLKYVADDFDERNAKVGAAKMSDITSIIDYTRVKDDYAWNGSLSSVASGANISSFSDGEEYGVLYGGEKLSDGTYPLVIVVNGEGKIATTSAFAVVKSTGSSVNEADGIRYDSVTVLEGKEEKVLFLEEAFDGKAGDVIVYCLNNEGLVDEYYNLYSASGSINVADTAETAWVGGEYATYVGFDNAPDTWEDAFKNDKDNYANLGYGVVVDKTDRGVVIGTVEKDAKDKYQTVVYDEIDFASDVNVYVYETAKRASERLSVGATASVRATKLASRFVETDNDDVYQWTNAYDASVDKDGNKNENLINPNTVFYKTVEDEITDIIIVIND